MKKLSDKEWEETPTIIQWLYMMAHTQTPIGSNIIEKAMKEYPEYFPDELEHRRKYALIPQSVHDQYLAEYSKMNEEVYKDMPPSLGMMAWADHPKEYKEWKDAWDKAYPVYQQREKELHEKYYAPYGI